MKPKPSFRSFLILAGAGLMLASHSHAQATYYWDNNGDTVGYGDASGTWSGTGSLFSTSNTGETTPTGTVVTTGSDSVNFGINTVGSGLGTGVITVDGNVTVGGMNFGTQTTGTITFDAINGGKITTGNNQIRVNGVGSTVIFNADFVGATTQWFGNSRTIYNGDHTNTGTSTIRGGHTLQFGSTSTLNLSNRGINFIGSETASSTIQFSSNNNISIIGSMGNGGGAEDFIIKDGSASSTLTFNASSTFAGEYRIDAGTLRFVRRDGLYNTVTTNWLASKIKVGNTGVLALNVGGSDQFTTADVTTLLTNLGGANGTGTTGFAAGSAIGIDTTNAPGAVTLADVIADSTGSGGGALGLNKLGTGTLVLSNASNYSGATKIIGGTLQLGAGGSIDNTSMVSLGTSGTFDVSAKGNYTVNSLTGSGNVIGSITVSTQLAIGNSPGTANFDSDLTLGAASTYLYEMVGGTNEADLGDVVGGLTIGSGAILDLVQLGTFNTGDKFTLFAYDGSLIGTFLDSNLNSLADGDTFTDAGGLWQIDYNDATAGLNGGTSGSNTYVTITALTPIPEPSSALLGALGLIALLQRRRS